MHWKTKFYLDDIFRSDLPTEAQIVGDSTLGNTLNRLDNTRRVLRKLKKADPDAGEFFAKVGAPLASQSMLIQNGMASPAFMNKMPTYLGVFLGCDTADKGQEKVNLSAIFAKKIAGQSVIYKHLGRSAAVQPTNGQVYYVSVVYMIGALMHSASFAVSVLPDGSIRPLKCLTATPCKPGFYRMEWRHGAVADIARDNGDTIEGMAGSLFGLVSSAIPDKRSIRVRAEKGRERIAFRIHRRAAPKFFSDRDVADKQNNKIFHYRRGHYRWAGKEIFVRPCYPGARQFSWNGWNINISIPGFELTDIDISGFDISDGIEEKPSGFVGDDALAAALDKLM